MGASAPARRTRGRVHAHVRQANIATVQTEGGGNPNCSIQPGRETARFDWFVYRISSYREVAWAVCSKLLTLRSVPLVLCYHFDNITT